MFPSEPGISADGGSYALSRKGIRKRNTRRYPFVFVFYRDTYFNARAGKQTSFAGKHNTFTVWLAKLPSSGTKHGVY